MSPDTLAALALSNPVNRAVLERLPALGLPQAHLVAGCVYQAVWNHRSGLPADHGVKDYDVFYFDPDTSYGAEDRAIRAAEALYADLGAVVEVRNQARVHLWYEGRFGRPYPALTSARDGIDRFLVACTCVGVTPDGRGGVGEVYAPYGLDELWDGVLRPNPAIDNPPRLTEKLASYRARWPWLTVVA
ncbi:nucleotidyltransferase family protein [Aerophototrophica crusticola]|uniref:Nucleotidyltransferase family protein n=1 Tax=Aerophototrophica crusticola TaxID=1709002 RepID=A0A858R2Z7_9PROT|nr:nucleotidyltransferase family protein [Rhodospirillaceae bacterium B3]